MRTLFLCIGGPLDGQKLLYEEVTDDYSQFNCAYRCNRTKFAKKRAKERGEIIPPSAIYIHDSLLKESEDEN